MEERRKNQRGRTYLGGTIVFNNRFSTLDCLVRNMSHDGAMLVFGDAVKVPQEFDLMIRKQGESFRAQMRWIREGAAGIRFLRPESCAVVPIETARRIRQLEEERKALSARVAQLSEPA